MIKTPQHDGPKSKQPSPQSQIDKYNVLSLQRKAPGSKVFSVKHSVDSSLKSTLKKVYGSSFINKVKSPSLNHNPASLYKLNHVPPSAPLFQKRQVHTSQTSKRLDSVTSFDFKPPA